MRHERKDTLGSSCEEVFSGESESSTRVGHVVDEDGDFVLDVPDEDHTSDLIRLFTFFVEQGEI